MLLWSIQESSGFISPHQVPTGIKYKSSLGQPSAVLLYLASTPFKLNDDMEIDDIQPNINGDGNNNESEEAIGEYCLLLQDDDCESISNPVFEPRGSINSNDLMTPQQVRESLSIGDNFIKAIPIIAPIISYFTYGDVVAIFRFLIEAVSSNNWQAVDGGKYATQIITPAINGIVLPSASILFATLIGNTVTTLRQRQLDVRICLNNEANEIRTLQSLIDFFPLQQQMITPSSPSPNSDKSLEMDIQDKARAYLIQYTGRIIAESQPGVTLGNLEFTGSMDSEMNGLLVQLNEMGRDSARNSNPAIISESYGAISRLNSYRSTRISALQSTFPALHFAIVSALGFSICLTFLMETNQEILFFMNETQLRILWTILIGTLTALGVVCYDLSDPFRGEYQILSSVDQLFTVRDVLRASDKLKKYKRIQKNYADRTTSALFP